MGTVTRRTSRPDAGGVPSRDLVLIDTMVVIEAVDTGCWNAVTGGRRIVTVDECAEELRRGDPSMPGYVPVSEEDFELCGCDRAAVAATHALGWLDQVVSLQALATSAGARPRRPFRRQYTERELAGWRTTLMLAGWP